MKITRSSVRSVSRLPRQSSNNVGLSDGLRLGGAVTVMSAPAEPFLVSITANAATPPPTTSVPMTKPIFVPVDAPVMAVTIELRAPDTLLAAPPLIALVVC